MYRVLLACPGDRSPGQSAGKQADMSACCYATRNERGYIYSVEKRVAMKERTGLRREAEAETG